MTVRLSVKEFQDYMGVNKTNKYKAVKTEIDGISFDSKAEADRYIYLKTLEKLGSIKDLQLQPKFILQDSFKKNGKTYRAITYKADFSYFDHKKGHLVIEDVKGQKTEVYKIKKKLFEAKFKNLTIVEVNV